jgi:hypothetical protein
MRTISQATTVYRGESQLFYAAVALLVLSIAAYVYFLSASVVHVVMRKEVDAEIAAASTAMSTLEAEYIELQHALSADIATANGFVAAPKKLFVDRTTDTLVVSRN